MSTNYRASPGDAPFDFFFAPPDGLRRPGSRIGKDALKALRAQLDEAKISAKTVRAEINALNLHVTSYANLLLLPKSSVKDLERTQVRTKGFLEKTDSAVKATQKKLESVTLLITQTVEQIQLNLEQLKEISSAKVNTSDSAANKNDLKKLLNVLTAKQKTLTLLSDIYTHRSQQLKSLSGTLANLFQKYERRIREKKKEVLFQRNDGLSVFFNLNRIHTELKQLSGQTAQLVSPSFWREKWQTIWGLDRLLPAVFLLLFFVAMILLIRFQRFCRTNPSFHLEQHRFINLAFKIFYRSLPLIGATVLLVLFSRSELLFSTIPVIKLIIQILWTLLISRWCLDFILAYPQTGQHPMVKELLPKISGPVYWIRYAVILHLIASWVVGDDGMILFLGRTLFETGMLAWYIRFQRQARMAFHRISTDRSLRKSFLLSLSVSAGYVLFGSALIAELSGYGQMSVYWVLSWGQTASAMLWGGLLFFVMRDWHHRSQQISVAEEDAAQVDKNPFRWVLIWIFWLVWAGAFVVALIAAWGGRQTVIIGFLKALNYPLAIGSMQLRLLNFIYAFLILLLTHATARIWRLVFRNKVLAHSGIEIGLQESIISIAVYVFWVFGILFALHAVGINTTSLAVGLGALGIGLGFGLQNIFNNFISGIILLFERPIQVGDAIEINGIWAWVKKINVRATVVQTWDNASLIIPNSEFISSQVTNWSFRDMRLRRTIAVGIAYGSDVELARKTLLEIAEDMPRVLKNPAPDVLFADFGDSALIFKLRIWTVVDNMLAVESSLRFEIDRLFRERNLTIAFPQRDIHIRSGDMATQAPAGKNDAAS